MMTVHNKSRTLVKTRKSDFNQEGFEKNDILKLKITYIKIAQYPKLELKVVLSVFWCSPYEVGTGRCFIVYRRNSRELPHNEDFCLQSGN